MKERIAAALVVLVVLFGLGGIGYLVVDYAGGTERPVEALVIDKEAKPGYYSTHWHENCTGTDKNKLCLRTSHEHWNPPTWWLQLNDGGAAWWVRTSEEQYNRSARNETKVAVMTRVGWLSGHIYR